MNLHKRYRFEPYAGASVFFALIAADLIFGAKAAVKVLGAACVATGLLWMFRRAIPVGIEARAPSFYLVGWAALIAGWVMVAAGVAMLMFSEFAVCLLGWGAVAECL